MKSRWLLPLLFTLLLVLALGGYAWSRNLPQSPDLVVAQTLIPEVKIITTSKPVSPSPLVTLTPTPVAVLPANVNHNVPFTAQAPHAVWDELHGEACEEASALMAFWYVTGKQGVATGVNKNRVMPDEAEAAIQAAVQWQKQTFGYYEDTTAAETIRMLREHLGVSDVNLITEVSADSLRSELAQGRILLVPAAGQLLKNPNFRLPGPPYHMVVVRGYSAEGFIVNDPGTRNGEEYVYASDILLDAIHDWTGDKSTITQGKKVIISVGKK